MSHFYVKKKENKYHNEKVTVDGVTFDSRGEYRRWCFLKMLERTGEISNLQYHKNFTLIPKGTIEILRFPDNSEMIVKKYDRKRYYEADYVYTNKEGVEVVEDFKGFITQEFEEKKELFKKIYGKDIHIVKQINENVH